MPIDQRRTSQAEQHGWVNRPPSLKQPIRDGDISDKTCSTKNENLMCDWLRK